jgi:L-fucose mutarotase
MLKGIDPVLGPDALMHLRAMGHGDEVVIADANFPAASVARHLVRCDGANASRIVAAVAALMPLDDFVPCAAFRMAVTGRADWVPPVCEEFAAILATAGYERPVEPLERMAFYERARDAWLVIATGETRLWANLILKKGALAPDPAGT